MGRDMIEDGADSYVRAQATPELNGPSRMELGLYLPTHPEGKGYGRYHEYVVCAASEYEAKCMHPGGTSDDWYTEWGRAVWVQRYELHLVTVKKIGTADTSLIAGTVITKSYGY